MKFRGGSRKSWLVTVALCVGLFAATVAGLAWYTQKEDAQIEKNETTRQAYIEKTNEQIEAIEARKAAEELARQKAANEAAEKAARGESVDAANCAASSTHIDPTQIDVVVNKKHCMQPLDFVPGDLVNSNGALLSAKAVDAFNRMYLAAAAAGLPFSVTSSYRSYDTQVSTYNHWVRVSGAQGADTYSARPGYSEHQTGLVIDVAAGGCALDCFGTTLQYEWFQDNAAKFGFIQRYQKGSEDITGYSAEEWHYRYVGIEVAQDMKAKNSKTLEEYWGVPGGDYFYNTNTP